MGSSLFLAPAAKRAKRAKQQVGDGDAPSHHVHSVAGCAPPQHRELSVSLALGHAVDVDAILEDEHAWRGAEAAKGAAAERVLSNLASLFGGGTPASAPPGASALWARMSSSRSSTPLIPSVLDAFLTYSPEREGSTTGGQLELCTVSEVGGTDLHAAMTADPHRFASSPALTAEVARQTIALVAGLHGRGLMHRDLKPANILVAFVDAGVASAGASRTGAGFPVVRLCDMGSARPLLAAGERGNSFVTSRYYRAPELLCASPTYSEAVDVWSLGCTLFDLYARPLVAVSDSAFRDVASGRGRTSGLQEADADLCKARDEVEHASEEKQEELLTWLEQRRVKREEQRRAYVELFPGMTSDAHQLIHVVNLLGTPSVSDVEGMRLLPFAAQALAWMAAEMSGRAAERVRRPQAPVAVLPVGTKTRTFRFRAMTSALWPHAFAEACGEEEEAEEGKPKACSYTAWALQAVVATDSIEGHEGITSATAPPAAPPIAALDLAAFMTAHARIPPPMARVIARMLTWDPRKRSTAVEALADPDLHAACAEPYIPPEMAARLQASNNDGVAAFAQ